MEWSGRQQLLFLVHSALVGAGIGLLFDCISGCLRLRKYRRYLFIIDGLFGALAALATFFGSLVITDGYMHPLLFLGIGLGFLIHWIMQLPG